MSTRGIYTFEGFDEAHHVYVHYDNYLTGAADHLKAALPLAWELPRYEPDEFAAAFVAGVKTRQGGVRLCHTRHDAADVEYGYLIRPNKDIKSLLEVVVTSTNFWGPEPEETHIWTGPLLEFIVRAQEIEDEYYGEDA